MRTPSCPEPDSNQDPCHDDGREHRPGEDDDDNDEDEDEDGEDAGSARGLGLSYTRPEVTSTASSTQPIRWMATIIITIIGMTMMITMAIIIIMVIMMIIYDGKTIHQSLQCNKNAL